MTLLATEKQQFQNDLQREGEQSLVTLQKKLVSATWMQESVLYS